MANLVERLLRVRHVIFDDMHQGRLASTTRAFCGDPRCMRFGDRGLWFVWGLGSTRTAAPRARGSDPRALFRDDHVNLFASFSTGAHAKRLFANFFNEYRSSWDGQERRAMWDWLQRPGAMRRKAASGSSRVRARRAGGRRGIWSTCTTAAKPAKQIHYTPVENLKSPETEIYAP